MILLMLPHAMNAYMCIASAFFCFAILLPRHLFWCRQAYAYMPKRETALIRSMPTHTEGNWLTRAYSKKNGLIPQRTLILVNSTHSYIVLIYMFDK